MSARAPVWRRGLAVLVPVLLLAVLWHLVDPRALIDRLAGAKPGWLLLAALLVNLQTGLSAWRWQMVSTALGQPMALRQAIAEYYLSQLVNQTLPGGVLGDAARAVRARAGDLRRAALAVVIERLAGQIVLFAVLGLAFATTLALPGGIDWPRGAGWAAGAGLALVAGIGLLATRRLAAGFAAHCRRAFWPSARGGLRQVALGLAILACNLAAFACAARATGSALPLAAILTLIPLILTAMLLPVSIAGWGWREGAAAALFPLAGLAPEAGLAASIAFGGVLLISALPGLWPLAMQGPGGAKPVAIGPEQSNSNLK